MLAVAGISVAAGGAVWLVKSGIPFPLAIMAGYCTLVAAAWSVFVPFVFRMLRQRAIPRISQKTEEPPNYQAWRNRNNISLADAACLFADLIPSTQNKARPNVREYTGSLIDAVTNGEIKFILRNSESAASSSQYAYELANVDEYTRVAIDALKAFARPRGQI